VAQKSSGKNIKIEGGMNGNFLKNSLKWGMYGGEKCRQNCVNKF
jgi:hypothetical protein